MKQRQKCSDRHTTTYVLQHNHPQSRNWASILVLYRGLFWWGWWIISSESRPKRLLIIAVKVVTITNSKQITVPLEKPYAVRHSPIRALTTFKSTVDDVCDRTIPGIPTGWLIGSGRVPSPGDNIMARRLGWLRGHPEPECCLEGDHRVCGNKVRVVQQVRSYGFSTPSIVVIPICTSH